MVTLAEAKERHPEAPTFRFGDSRALCERLLGLVISGPKRATCESLRAFDQGDEPVPVVGETAIALDWDGAPVLVIETTEVTHRRFCDVDADFALAEGENDSLEGWRADHQAYFERQGFFAPDMIVVCERFRLVEVFRAPPT